MKYIFLLLFIIPGAVIMGQSFTINGTLQDSLSEPLSYATVILLNPIDSSMVDFATSNNTGNFTIKNIKPGNYLLRISFVGYETYFKSIQTPASGSILDMGSIRLSVQNEKLGEVTIKAQRPPVVVKKDTIEFNASSFKTNPNANVEDLLKRLPGIHVESNGRIMAQGEEVKKVEIEGKPFFGNDPSLATRNLPANVVDKVQVYDKKSEQASFTGIEDGEKQKTINLKLKEDKKKQFFGNVSGGAGSNERFRSKLSLNRFNHGNQLSFLGMAGNTSEQGFSLEDYLNFSGAMQQMAGGIKFLVHLDEDNKLNGVPLDIGKSNGIITNYAGGVNINHDFGKKTNINASYFGNILHQDLQTNTDQINFMPGSEFILHQADIRFNESSNQRLNFLIDQKIDSFNSVRFVTAFNYTLTKLEEEVRASNTENDSLINGSQRNLYSSGDQIKSNSEVLFRHKFKRTGRTVSLGIRTELEARDIRSTMKALNHFYSRNEISGQNQEYMILTGNRNYQGKIAFTDRFGSGMYYEISYKLGADNGKVNQEVYNLMKEAELDSGLTNKFKSTYLYNDFGLNLRFVKSNYNLEIGGSLKQSHLNGTVEFNEAGTSKSYFNFLPMASFQYDFTSTRHLAVKYTSSTEQPALLQLQPVVNNTDPMNIFSGNPELSPAFNHSVQLQYNLFSPMSYFSLLLMAQADYRTNAISVSQTIDENLVTFTMPVNVKYDKSGFTRMDIVMPLKFINSRLNCGIGYRKQNGLTVINNSLNGVNSKSIDGSIQYNLNFAEKLDLNLKAEINSQSARFGGVDQKYFNNDYSADITFQFLRRCLLNVKMDYIFCKDKTSGFKQEIPVLDAYASCFVFKNYKGELKFSVSNMLDKTLGISQTAMHNYFRKDVTNSLGRYLMISFTYELNKAVNHKPAIQRRGVGG